MWDRRRFASVTAHIVKWQNINGLRRLILGRLLTIPLSYYFTVSLLFLRAAVERTAINTFWTSSVTPIPKFLLMSVRGPVVKTCPQLGPDPRGRHGITQYPCNWRKNNEIFGPIFKFGEPHVDITACPAANGRCYLGWILTIAVDCLRLPFYVFWSSHDTENTKFEAIMNWHFMISLNNPPEELYRISLSFPFGPISNLHASQMWLQ